jgi:hypothetical protein
MDRDRALAYFRNEEEAGVASEGESERDELEIEDVGDSDNESVESDSILSSQFLENNQLVSENEENEDRTAYHLELAKAHELNNYYETGDAGSIFKSYFVWFYIFINNL